MIHTNRCKNGGKTKEEHLSITEVCKSRYVSEVPDSMQPYKFYDSGLAALDAHKEELWEAINEFKNAPRQRHLAVLAFRLNDEEFIAIDKVFAILNQIEKEKFNN